RGTFVGAHRGIGRSFRHVLSALERGVPAHATGQPTAGIGAAMRIAPVSLYFGDDIGALFESAMAASLMTHLDVRSLSGALAVAHATRRLAAGSERDPSLLLWVSADLFKDEKRIAEAYAHVVLKLDCHAHSLSRAISHAESLIDLRRDQVLAAI